MAEAKGAATADDAAAGAHTFESTDKARTTDQDVLGAEALRRGMVSDTHAWSANVKRTYDRTEEEISASVKAAQDHLNNVRTVQLQMLTNLAVNTDNLQKQHLAHRDLATDRTWNLDEQGNQAVIALAKLADAIKTTEGSGD